MSCLLAACAMQVGAQKIDFNLNGKQNQSLADGYVNWSPGRVKTASQSFKTAIDSTITVAISAADGVWSNGVRDNWNKNLVTQKDKLIYDGIYSCYIDANNDWTTSTTEAQGIKITISGLEEGSTITMGDTLKMRADASTDSEQVDTAYVSETVTIIANYSNGWTKIKNVRGKEGFVKTEYLQ